MTYNAGSLLVTSVEGAVVSTYTFDANGNQTAVNAGGSRTTYAYDYENRMRTAIDPSGARSTLAYWADGMRRFLEVGGTRTTFVWDGSDYLQSRTPSDVTTFSTVDAQILDSETGGSESLMVPDPLGSVVKVLDASGNQVYDAAYWPYGEIRNSVGVNDTSWGYVGTWGYHFDTSRRLYVRARVLDPVTGRWYSVDPLWPNQNPYEVADGTPILEFDYSGLCVAPTPGGCTKKDGAAIVNFCTCCTKTDPLGIGFCKYQCDSLSRDYYNRCQKPNRKPKPGERWWPIPGVGVAPLPPPPKPDPSMPTFGCPTPEMIDFQDGQDCVKRGLKAISVHGQEASNAIGHFSSTCQLCCTSKGHFQGSSCAAWCSHTASMMIQGAVAGANGFGRPGRGRR